MHNYVAQSQQYSQQQQSSHMNYQDKDNNNNSLSVSKSANQQISQVKYRLEELMRRFPNELSLHPQYYSQQNHLVQYQNQQQTMHFPQYHQQAIHHYHHLQPSLLTQKQPTYYINEQQKQKKYYQNSAPQLAVKRSGLLLQQSVSRNGVFLNFNQDKCIDSVNVNKKGIALTEMKAKLPYSKKEQPFNEAYKINNDQQQIPQSLNYSMTTMKNTSIHYPKNNNEGKLLYEHTVRQQQLINQLLSKIETLQQHNQHLSKHINHLEQQNHQLKYQYHRRQGNFNRHQAYPLQQTQQQSKKQQQCLSNQAQSQQYYQQYNQLHKRSPSQLSIQNTQQQKVKILEEEKTQLTKKIAWMNKVIKQIINKDRINVMKTLTQQNKSNNNTINKPQQQQAQVQTSLINPPTQTTIPAMQCMSQFNYKRLYQKQIEHQQRIKAEIFELENIQSLYNQQYEKVLQEIKEIKSNREYYRRLKQQLTHQKQPIQNNNHVIQDDHPNSKLYLHKKYSTTQQSTLGRHSQPRLVSKLNHSSASMNKQDQRSATQKIFQNQIIYHLKNQNDLLKQKILSLTHQLLPKSISKEIIKKPQKQSIDRSVSSSKKTNPFSSTPNSSHNIQHLSSYRQQQHPTNKHHKNTLMYSHQPHHIQYSPNLVQNSHFLRKNHQVNPFILNQRPESKVSIVDKLKRRPHSIIQLPSPFLQDRINSQKKMTKKSQQKSEDKSIDRNRQNGRISYLSASSLSGIRNNCHYRQDSLIRKESKEGNRDKYMKSKFQTKQKDSIKDVNNIKGSLYCYQTNEQKSLNRTNQQSARQVVINRYNNFIKTMKKKFMINSTIIGKQISKDHNTISTD